jgi:pimeloyl-ACP methyl ester carboxylesterase
MSTTMDIQRSSVAGLSILRRAGGGTPLVLLHGIGSNAESWLPLMRALPPGREVIAWDAPGYGISAPLPAASPVPADYAAVLGSLLDALGHRRVLLMGHSLGCLFAGAFARHHAGRVEKLALSAPALGYGVPAGAPLPYQVQARIDDLNNLGPSGFAAKRAARLVFDAGNRPAVLAAVQQAMGAVNPHGYAQAVRALGAGDLLAEAAHLALPVLAVTGAEDLVTPPEGTRRLHALLPQPIRLAEIVAAGHAMPQEKPAELVAILQEAGFV